MNGSTANAYASRLAKLMASHIRLAVDEATADVIEITELLIGIAGDSGKIKSGLNQLCTDSGFAEQLTELQERTTEMANNATHAAMSLQFEDRLRQRMENVFRILNRYSDVARSSSITDCQWEPMLLDMRAEYTTDLERVMFDRAFPDIAPEVTVQEADTMELF